MCSVRQRTQGSDDSDKNLTISGNVMAPPVLLALVDIAVLILLPGHDHITRMEPSLDAASPQSQLC